MSSYEDMEKEAMGILHEAFGRLDESQMQAFEKWFEQEFHVEQSSFRIVNDNWNAIDAARQDSFRLVLLAMQNAWCLVHGKAKQTTYVNK